jgi:MraZ protein
VDAKGRLSVPAFVRNVIDAQLEARRIVHRRARSLALPHRLRPQLCPQPLQRDRAAAASSRRIAAAPVQDHYARARRAFGMTEDVPLRHVRPASCLPPMMRRKGAIEDLALFVGVGGTVEIWNPRLALEQGDADLKDIAAWRLEEKGIAL